MGDIFKPMLAKDADIPNIVYPVLASPKLDGVRAIVRDGVVYSRSNKPIPSAHVQNLFRKLEGFDGELIVGEPTSEACYRDTISGVMAQDKVPDVYFHVFDYVSKNTLPYNERQEFFACYKHAAYSNQSVCVVEQRRVNDEAELLAYEAECLGIGYEGLILRAPNGPYKQGRSTVKEGYLLKVKRFLDAEATIVGFEERMENRNEKTINELGRSSRSSHKENKFGRGDLGALICKTHEGIEFGIGTGFDDAERTQIWGIRNNLLGKIVKYKFFPVGVKEAPRHPVFLGFRNPIDL